ncbi:MAG: DUF1491 family protein [Alphaproteobacteria bacterium]|nr:DUF1491 family protein [Alphaproteobacteria bacterium]
MRDLPSHLWVAALMRRAQAAGAFVTIVRRGDAGRGDVLLKVCRERGKAQLYAPAFSMEGAAGFERLPAGIDDPDEAAVDALIARRATSDRDLWVIEIEDRAGRHFLTEAVR